MATDTLPVPSTAVEAVSGEVVKTPLEILAEQEKIIRRNVKKFLDTGMTIGRAFNIIWYNDLWKLHTDAKGKRKYTSWGQYLTDEFGWEKSRARALQLMKADLPLAIEAGDVPAEAGEKKERTRTAPTIDAVKAANVTSTQLEKVRDAMVERLGNVEDGDLRDELSTIFDSVTGWLDEGLNMLGTFIANAEAESETADDDDSDDDEDASES